MKRLMMIALTAALWGAGYAQAQYYTTYYYPATTYYQPSTVYYAAPQTAYYGAAPGTTYYASAPTTVYYGAAPATTYYASAPTTVYYGTTPAVTTYYRPLVGRGITRVGYSTSSVAYPVTNNYRVYYPWW